VSIASPLGGAPWASFRPTAPNGEGKAGIGEEFLSKSKPEAQPRAKGSQQRLKILGLRFGDLVVLIRWLHAGRRLEETVPFHQARHRRLELEAQGAVVYWSERLVYPC